MEDRQRPSSVRPPAAWVTCVTGDSNKKRLKGFCCYAALTSAWWGVSTTQLMERTEISFPSWMQASGPRLQSHPPLLCTAAFRGLMVGAFTRSAT
jgi:hypothetical protein